MPLDCADNGYLREYSKTSPQAIHLVRLAKFLLENHGGYSTLRVLFGDALRRAYDEVIDMPRTGRWSLAQLEKTEKTYVGTKVEILIRHELGLPKGKKLDLLIDGTEVDIKNTIRSTWTIPREAVGEVCLVVRGDDNASTFSAGLLWARAEFLTTRPNRDGKVSVSARQGMSTILWLVNEGVLPPNLFEAMPEENRNLILDPSVGGTVRLVRLFRIYQGIEIPRHIILCVAQQKDPMKRLRKNGGARDLLLTEGLKLFSGKGDADELQRRNMLIAHDSFICLPF
jgi:Restriction endonuclease NaeI